MLVVSIEKELDYFTLNVQFSLKQEIIAICGTSGAGKTTLLNCIAGLVEPTNGIIRLNDQIIFQKGKINVPTRKREMGYMFQNYALFPHMTVWENVTYQNNNEALIKNLMKQLKIEHLINDYPQQISGGEKQRVALTRALATKPKLLLLDEPFSAMDQNTRKKGQLQLKKIQKQWQIPTIFITHQIDEARQLANRIIYLENGEIVKEEKIHQ